MWWVWGEGPLICGPDERSSALLGCTVCGMMDTNVRHDPQRRCAGARDDRHMS